MASKSQGVFLSERTYLYPCRFLMNLIPPPVGNKRQLEGLLETMERLVLDLMYLASQVQHFSSPRVA